MLSWNLISRRRDAIVIGLVGLLAFGVVLYVGAPGYMTADSGDQLEQARSFQLRDDNPVLMALIWRYMDRILPGPLGMLVLHNGMYWAGLSVLFWALRGPLVARALGLLAVGLFPPSWVNMPVIWKDSLMQGALIAAVGCLVIPAARFRAARYVAAVVLFVIGIGARHNAAAAVWPLLALPLLGLPVLVGRSRWLRLLLAFGASLVLTALLTIAVDRALTPLAKRTEFWQMIPVFDLSGMSLRTGKLLVEPESGILTPGMGLDEIRRFYQPNYMNKLYYCMPFRGKRCVPVFRQTVDRERLAALSANWRRAILEHPVAYFKHRRGVSKTLLGLAHAAPGIFYADGAPFHRLAADYPLRPVTLRVFNWIDGQFRHPWLRPWVYVLLGCILLPVALIRYARGGSVLSLLFLLAGLSYLFSLFISTGSGSYRYTVWTTFCVMVAVAVLVLDCKWLRRPSAGASASAN